MRLATSGTGVLRPGRAAAGPGRAAGPGSGSHRSAHPNDRDPRARLHAADRSHLRRLPPRDRHRRRRPRADDAGYRVAFAEAFARRGIYPADVPNVSPDGLLWQGPADPGKWASLGGFLRSSSVNFPAFNDVDRERAYQSARGQRRQPAPMAGAQAQGGQVPIAVALARPRSRAGVRGALRPAGAARHPRRRDANRHRRRDHPAQGPARRSRRSARPQVHLPRRMHAAARSRVRCRLSDPLRNQPADLQRPPRSPGSQVPSTGSEPPTRSRPGPRGNEPFALVHAVLGRE